VKNNNTPDMGALGRIYKAPQRKTEVKGKSLALNYMYT